MALLLSIVCSVYVQSYNDFQTQSVESCFVFSFFEQQDCLERVRNIHEEYEQDRKSSVDYIADQVEAFPLHSVTLLKSPDGEEGGNHIGDVCLVATAIELSVVIPWPVTHYSAMEKRRNRVC